jgi:flagellar motor switch protein FliN/FliY
MGKKKKEEQKGSNQAVIDEKEDQGAPDQAAIDEKEDKEVPSQAVIDEEAIKPVQLSPLNPVQGNPRVAHGNIDMLMDVKIPILVELGHTEMMMRDVLALSPGSLVELDTLAGEPVKITIRGKIIAQGEVVVVDENFGVKVTKIANQQERIKSVG